MALFVVKKRLERHWISDARRSKSALPREIAREELERPANNGTYDRCTKGDW